MKYDKIMLAHGSGGLLTNELVSEKFLPMFNNAYLNRQEDSAVFDLGGERFCFTTDSYVVNPIFFPGGDIGSLAIHGTVNDIAMCGGKPLFLSAGFILEEGFGMEELERVIRSMTDAAVTAGVQIVTGDTKVVARGAADGLYINTSAIGIITYENTISPQSIQPGDAIIINGTIGDHGTAILSKRENLGFESEIISDSAPLNTLVETALNTSSNIHCMRDATRGGLGTILAEIAEQSGCIIDIMDTDIPVNEKVRGICEILGLDPLFIANEGKMVTFCSRNDAEKILEIMKSHEYGRDAAIIGYVKEKKDKGRLILNTSIGGKREIDLPAGELVPRIC